MDAQIDMVREQLRHQGDRWQVLAALGRLEVLGTVTGVGLCLRAGLDTANAAATVTSLINPIRLVRRILRAGPPR
jgi:hypothetical protein